MFKEGEHRCNTYTKGNGWLCESSKSSNIGRIFSYYWKKKKEKKERETEEEKEIEKKIIMKIMKSQKEKEEKGDIERKW